MELNQIYKLATDSTKPNQKGWSGRNCRVKELIDGRKAVLLLEFSEDEKCCWHIIVTTPVKTLSVENGTIIFQTQNTTYTLKPLD